MIKSKKDSKHKIKSLQSSFIQSFHKEPSQRKKRDNKKNEKKTHINKVSLFLENEIISVSASKTKTM